MASKKQAAEKVKPEAPAAAQPAAPTHKPGMKIIAMRVENIKRVHFAQIRPKGAIVTIAGNNGQGKSTILDAIDWAINGTGNITSAPIRKGARTGRIEVDLGDYKVVRDFTIVEGGKEPFITKLTVMGRHKEKFPSPQSLLDGFMGTISFDPLEFIRMKPDTQLKALRSLVTLDVDLDKVEEERKEAYDTRREIGREVDSAKARLAALPVPPEDLPKEPIDTLELTTRLEGAANFNSVIAAQEQKQAAHKEKAHQYTRAADQQRADAQHYRQQAEQADQLAIEADNAAQAELDEAVKMKIAERVDTAEVSRALQAAQVTNGAIQRRDAYKSVAYQVQDAETKWNEQDAIVKAKEKEKVDSISRAKMPIAGLTIGEGEVLFNELPFTQASNAEQIRISVALGMASNPTLRVLRIKDGSLLDGKSLKLIEEMTVAHDYQTWIETVQAGDRVAVVMEDGEASGAEAEKDSKNG